MPCANKETLQQAVGFQPLTETVKQSTDTAAVLDRAKKKHVGSTRVMHSTDAAKTIVSTRNIAKLLLVIMKR